MIIEDLIVRINKLKHDDPKVIELNYDDFNEFTMFVARNRDKPILSDSGREVEKGCYVFGGCEIKRESPTMIGLDTNLTDVLMKEELKV